MSSLFTAQALHGENGVQNGTLHAQNGTFYVGNGYENEFQNGSQNGF